MSFFDISIDSNLHIYLFLTFKDQTGLWPTAAQREPFLKGIRVEPDRLAHVCGARQV